MTLDDSMFGFLDRLLAGHVSLQGNFSRPATINPALLTLHSHVAPTEGNTIVATHATSSSAMGNVPQEALRLHPPAWPPNHPRCPYFDVNGDVTVPSPTRVVRSTRQTFRGSRVDNAAPKRCQWQAEGSLVCDEEITGQSVPKHLADHGIENMSRDCIAQCCWRECGAKIKRQGMTRHFREVHLGLRRKSGTGVDTPVRMD